MKKTLYENLVLQVTQDFLMNFLDFQDFLAIRSKKTEKVLEEDLKNHCMMASSHSFICYKRSSLWM